MANSIAFLIIVTYETKGPFSTISALLPPPDSLRVDSQFISDLTPKNPTNSYLGKTG